MFKLILCLIFSMRAGAQLKFSCPGAYAPFLQEAQDFLGRLGPELDKRDLSIEYASFKDGRLFIYGKLHKRPAMLAEVDYKIKDGVLSFDMQVHAAARQLNISNFAVEVILRRHPEVAGLSHFLEKTNLDVFLMEAMKRAGHTPRLAEGQSAVEYYIRVGQRLLQKIPPEERQRIYLEAAEQTPIFKSCSHTRIPIICPQGVAVDTTSTLSVTFQMCPP